MSSEAKYTISTSDRDRVTLLFIICFIAFLIFVLAVALAEYRDVEYARTVVGDLPIYLVFAIIIIVIYLAAWYTGRRKSEAVGIWYYS